MLKKKELLHYTDRLICPSGVRLQTFLEVDFFMFLSSFFVQRSAEWFDEDTLFTSGLTVCPLNAKVNEMAEGMFSRS